MRVLDPGVGTGELLAAVLRRCPDAHLTGWDIDPTALAAAGELVPGATLELRSALDLKRDEVPGLAVDGEPQTTRPHAGSDCADPEFDLVIGNPPYFQVPVTPDLKERFGEVISGRANTFALFFKAGLDLLAPEGTLAFVVPPSMNSGAYFEALREHIVARARITDLTLLEGTGLFEGANTAAQLLVLRKNGESGHRNPASQFVFERRDDDAGFRRVVFSRNPGELEAGFKGRKTLWQLGFEAVTGTVVWNQHRATLRDRAGPGSVPLVWSGDLRGGTLELDSGSSRGQGTPPGQDDGRRRRRSGAGLPDNRPGHVIGRTALSGPALLVNRVVGSVGRGEIRTGLILPGVPFLAENHVNVIRPRSGFKQRVDWEELQSRMSQPGVVERLRLLTGNTQISATELTHLIPV
jgi:adenine-specific DNA-methyltransferase